MRRWYTGGGAPIALESLCEHDLCIAVARCEGQRAGIKDLAKHTRSASTSSSDSIERRPHLRDRHVTLAEPLLERAPNEPWTSHRTEVDQGPGVRRHRDRPEHHHVSRTQVGDPMETAAGERDVPMLLHAQLDKPRTEALDPERARRRVVRDGSRRAGGEHCRKKPLLVRGGVRERPVDPTVHSHPLADSAAPSTRAFAHPALDRLLDRDEAELPREVHVRLVRHGCG